MFFNFIEEALMNHKLSVFRWLLVVFLIAGTFGNAPVAYATPSLAAGPALTVNAAADVHAISPYIYGMNFATEAIAADLRLPVRRWGGNSTSRYNWQLDVHNTGMDWYFENIPEDNAHPELLPDGSASDKFVDQDRRTSTKTVMTVPLIGWTPKARKESHPYDCGFKVSKYGAQDSVDVWDTDCGNGEHNGIALAGNDPHDTSIETTPAFVSSWVSHLTGKYGTAANGGVMFYNLDNEPMLWNSTHRDVHPSPTSYNELRDRTWAYAAAIKSADASAKTLGPVVWGWCAYFYSAVDGCSPGADRASHGNTDFIPWYLQQMKAYEQAHGVRILDYLDVHIYPQVDGVYSDSLGSAAVQAARLRSTRQLWDTSYVHEGWIGQPVYLIPRMKDWVANNYPGTKLAITEYNWGAPEYMNGALAQADILGIFGREGLDLATLWGPTENFNAPGIFAFRMYRNYDGTGGAFGDTSVQATSTDQSQLAVYAAKRSQSGALTLMIINKTGSAVTSDLSLSGFQPTASAQVYRYSSANLSAIVHEADLAVTSSGFTASYPSNSITLIVIPSATAQPTFADVPFDHPLYPYIQALYDAGYTAGCSTNPLMFCPDTILDRAQSAVFMLRGQLGSDYTPPSAPWNTFADNWIGFEWAQPWAEGMWQEGLTAGCQSNPLMYCPSTQLPRVEASVFGLRMKYGVNYSPPPATGTLFADMTDTSYWGIGWAEQAYLDGLLPACGTQSSKPMFCPSELVNRGWGAYLIVKAKGLPTP
jgi:hypothetical protein